MSQERKESDFRKVVEAVRSRHDRLRNEGLRQLDNWVIYGYDFREYENDFEEILRGINLTTHVASKPSPVVIDLMSPADAMRSLSNTLGRGQNLTAIAVSMEDLRIEREKVFDERLGITLISGEEGDLVDYKSIKKIKEELKGRKADLIVMRPKGGFEDLPKHPKFYALGAKRIWNELLSEDGGIFVSELPSTSFLAQHNIPIEKWVNLLQESGIFIRYLPKGRYLTTQRFGYVMAVKTPQSPKYLPHLPV